MSKKKTYEEFIFEANIKHNGKGYEYDKNTYKDTHTKMRIFCPKHGEFWQSPKSHLKYECKYCSYEKRGKNNTLTTQEFINKANIVHGEGKFNYSKSEYKGTRAPICIICPKHGEFWQKPNDHLTGKGCPKCNESKLEKKVENFLKENGINYISQYKPKWLGKQSLDFYIPEYKTAIECQGKQHFGIGQYCFRYGYNKIKELDEKKYNLCVKNNIAILYLVQKQDKSYIKDDIIYKEFICFDIKDLIRRITENK